MVTIVTVQCLSAFHYDKYRNVSAVVIYHIIIHLDITNINAKGAKRQEIPQKSKATTV